MTTVTVTQSSTKKEMLLYLTGISKNHILAICMHINRCADGSLPLYGNKSELIEGLSGVSRAALWAAIDDIVEDEDEEDFDDESEDEDGDCQNCLEDEDEDSQDEEE